MRSFKIKTKCGLGLRVEHIDDILLHNFKPDFWEIVPENWLFMPYVYRKKFEKIVSENMIVAHGVSLSIGSDETPKKSFLKKLKKFLDDYEIKYYSDHISFSMLNGHNTHELLPVPLTKDMLNTICDRIDMIQNYLKRELILENATYYYALQAEMSEQEFINELMQRSGAKLLLDINNVYINSINHNFNRFEFINSINPDILSYIHLAGHLNDDEFIVDTHGNDVCNEVWQLLEYVLKIRKVPCMIERDNEIPSFNELQLEYNKMCEIYKNV